MYSPSESISFVLVLANKRIHDVNNYEGNKTDLHIIIRWAFGLILEHIVYLNN